jgi:hypothetical protein
MECDGETFCCFEGVGYAGGAEKGVGGAYRWVCEDGTTIVPRTSDIMMG